MLRKIKKAFFSSTNKDRDKLVGEFPFISKEHQRYLNLINIGIAFSANDEGKLLARCPNQISYEVTTGEEIYILEELYIKNTYNLSGIPDNSILFDIGGNVCYTALMFANNPSIDKIYSFEPLKPTYQQGLRNLSRNPTWITSKIDYLNFGLGAEDLTMEIPYSYKDKGRISTSYLSSLSKDQYESIETIQIRNISSFIEELDLLGKRLICKLDCEGAEYSILESLSNHNLVEKFDVFMIEWHQKGISSLRNYIGNNFYFLHQPESSKSGMMYAFKR